MIEQISWFVKILRFDKIYVKSTIETQFLACNVLWHEQGTKKRIGMKLRITNVLCIRKHALAIEPTRSRIQDGWVRLERRKRDRRWKRYEGNIGARLCCIAVANVPYQCVFSIHCRHLSVLYLQKLSPGFVIFLNRRNSRFSLPRREFDIINS